MIDLGAVIVIVFVSTILGLIKYGSLTDSYKNQSWQLKFIEAWNDIVNFLIAGLIGYYFILVRLPLLLNGAATKASDLVLFIIFTLGIFGHLCIMSKNVSEGINGILKRVLEH